MLSEIHVIRVSSRFENNGPELKLRLLHTIELYCLQIEDLHE